MRLLIGTLALAAVTPSPPTPHRVHDAEEFRRAIIAVRTTGGSIELLPGRYAERLVVSGRFGGPVRIIGRPGARVQRLLLYRTRNVSVGPLAVRPITGDALLEVRSSRYVNLHDLDVSARGTRFSAGVAVPDSDWVSIQQSEFTHCGDRSPHWVNCLTLRGRARRIAVVHSWFHDCLGCDFIHGRVDEHLTVRSSRFERALPCRLGAIDARLLRFHLGRYASVRCKHQDLIELFGGDDLHFKDNHFGVYKRGGAQLYITGDTRGAVVARNVFKGTDPRVPAWKSRVGVLVGGRGGGPIPTFVRILRNKIYTGARRNDGYAASISISPGYGWRVDHAARPLIAHNVIGLLQTPARLCRGAKMIDNTILRGKPCPGGAARRWS